MNIRSDVQIDKEILRTLIRYQRLVASMATPVNVVLLLPLPPLVVIGYEELSLSSQESDNSDCVDIAAMVSCYESYQRALQSLRKMTCRSASVENAEVQRTIARFEYLQRFQRTSRVIQQLHHSQCHDSAAACEPTRCEQCGHQLHLG